MTTPKYELLKQFIRQNIHDGIWKSGDQLPPENILCEKFGISKITVKKAKHDLLAEGVLENLPNRKGSFVKRKTPRASSDFIGVFLDTLKESPFLDMLKGIEDKLWEHRLHTILCNANSNIEKVEAYYQSLLQSNVAGVIFTPLKGSEHNARIIALLAQHQVPYVLLDRYVPGVLATSVVSNNQQASKELTQFLIERGHTRILAVAGVACSSMDERVQGYLDAFRAAGLEPDAALILRTDEALLIDPAQASAELTRLIGLVDNVRDITACYALNMTLQAVIPPLFQAYPTLKKIEIATYDDIAKELIGITNHVAIVKQPAHRMGWEAARLLIEMLNEPDQPIIQMTLKAKIIEQVLE